MPQNTITVVQKKKVFTNEVNEELTTHLAQDFNNIIDSLLTSSQYVASAKVKVSVMPCKQHKPVTARVA
jgi:hypothetical protein